MVTTVLVGAGIILIIITTVLITNEDGRIGDGDRSGGNYDRLRCDGVPNTVEVWLSELFIWIFGQ